MSLSSILDEIKDGAVDEAIEDPIEMGEIESVEGIEALEHLVGLPAVVEKSKELSKSSMASRALEEIKGSELLDKSTALELFTMLPIKDNYTPFLTARPSRHNKSELLRGINSVHVVNEEYTSFMIELKELVDKSIPLGIEITQVCKNFKQELTSNLERLNKVPPIVMYQGVNVNLLTVAIKDVCYMDTSSLQFPMYEGKLDAIFRLLDQDAYLGKNNNLGSVSLKSVTEQLISLCNIHGDTGSRVNSVSSQLGGSISSGITYSSSFCEEVVNLLGNLSSLSKMFLGKDSSAQKAVNCLNFLV